MTMLILTIVVELVAVGVLLLTVCKRKTKYLKWILGVITVFTQAMFWYLAVNYLTVFIYFEVALEIAAILWCIYLIGIAMVVDSEKKKKRKAFWKNFVLVFASLLPICIFLSSIGGYYSNIRWSEPTIKIEKETFAVPEKLKAFDVKFQCIHKSKEGRYDLYQVWSNGICKIASYSEDECKVYRLPDSSSNLPRVETTVKTKYQYNHNFDAFQKPTVEDTSKEKTYELYISESSYKEDYTD